MKELIPCNNCEDCAVGYSCGFVSSKQMLCTKRDEDVTDEDGCTLGILGTPKTLCHGYDVTLNDHITYWQ